MKWLPIKNYEGLYEVSETGLIKALARTVEVKNQKPRKLKERILKPSSHKTLKYLQVSLWKDGKGKSFYLHKLVAETFIDNPLDKPEVNHLDGDRLNNRVSNLEWTTRVENAEHAVNTGLRTYSNRLSEHEFLDCLYQVISGKSYKTLSNEVPYKVPFLSTKLRKIAVKYNLETELDKALYLQRVKRARINGNYHT